MDTKEKIAAIAKKSIIDTVKAMNETEKEIALSAMPSRLLFLELLRRNCEMEDTVNKIKEALK